MILATKTGWMIGVNLLRETRASYYVKAWYEPKEIRVRKSDTTRKLCQDVPEAQRFIFDKATPKDKPE